MKIIRYTVSHWVRSTICDMFLLGTIRRLCPPHTITIRMRFDRAGPIVGGLLFCAGSIAYYSIAHRAIASDQDSLDIFV